ncbi:nucleotidyl transferase AbiEii/AbiGii toxin family protein [Candidatus Falkowbacteria bacterium]|nr:nucleotidyl transferase AbiEii/AbiGii toxin family protein [Candidatus Falkowbacteria bacterium]
MVSAVLSPKTKKLLNKLAQQKWLSGFYLAGGTALALQYGHRQSIDLDWFCPFDLDNRQLVSQVSQTGKFTLLNEDKNTVGGILDGVKVSFLSYPYPLLKKPTKYLSMIKLAAPLDIALMKLSAIGNRNTKKDFIDLYFFLAATKMNLVQLFGYLPKKFKKIDYSRYHFVKSLVYFAEADREPLPLMIKPVRWSAVKKFFQKEVSAFVKSAR